LSARRSIVITAAAAALFTVLTAVPVRRPPDGSAR
jgi:hypothetical protein